MPEKLGEGVLVFQSEQVRFGSDTLRLADFTIVRKGDTVCDLCSGTGAAVLQLFCGEVPPAKAVCVEIQPDAAALIERSVQASGLTGRIQVVCADLRRKPLPAGQFDAVLCNPPFYPLGSGCVSLSSSAAAARHEAFCTLQDVCSEAARLLRSGGRFTLCIRPERLADLVCLLRDFRLEPKRMRLLQHCRTKAPYLLLMEARRDGRPGLHIEPTLICQEESTVP